MKKYLKLIVRELLTITLLIFVWLNSHWSVSLAITLLVIGQEIEFIIHYLVKNKLI